jgi:hypothetical protein
LPTVAERHTLQTPFYTTSEGAALGEGSYVEFVAFILEGRFGGVESVNCERTFFDASHSLCASGKPSIGQSGAPLTLGDSSRLQHRRLQVHDAGELPD